MSAGSAAGGASSAPFSPSLFFSAFAPLMSITSSSSDLRPVSHHDRDLLRCRASNRDSMKAVHPALPSSNTPTAQAGVPCERGLRLEILLRLVVPRVPTG